MFKKIIFFASIIVYFAFVGVVKAQMPENVYLDLVEEDKIIEDDNQVAETFFVLGKNYIDDVKEYDDLLEGKAIDKDFSDDFKIKYRDFNAKKKNG